MIELASNPSEATRERLAGAVSWARRLYGTKANREIEVVVELPEPVPYSSPNIVGRGTTPITLSYTPALQRVGRKLRVHPALCKDTVPRYVIRYVVVMGLTRCTTPSSRLYEVKKGLAPYRKTAPEWLSRKGYGEDEWDI